MFQGFSHKQFHQQMAHINVLLCPPVSRVGSFLMFQTYDHYFKELHTQHNTQQTNSCPILPAPPGCQIELDGLLVPCRSSGWMSSYLCVQKNENIDFQIQSSLSGRWECKVRGTQWPVFLFSLKCRQFRKYNKYFKVFCLGLLSISLLFDVCWAVPFLTEH